MNARSRADWKRSDGDFSRQRLTIRSSAEGTPGLMSAIAGVSSLRVAVNVSAGESRQNGRRPVSISKRTMPSENTSDRGSVTDPDSCSGDMYPRLPINMPAPVIAPACVSPLVKTDRWSDAIFASPKSSSFTRPSGGDEYNFRFQVAVNDVLCVGGGQTERHLRAPPGHASHRKRALRELLSQAAALEQFHGRVRHAIFGAEAVDRENARMRQRRDCARLPLEAGLAFWIVAGVPGEDLERHVAAEHRIARAIHFAHAAGGNRRDHFVHAEAESAGKLHVALRTALFHLDRPYRYARSAGPLTAMAGGSSSSSWIRCGEIPAVTTFASPAHRFREHVDFASTLRAIRIRNGPDPESSVRLRSFQWRFGAGHGVRLGGGGPKAIRE